jgi:hypothetical protein
MTRTHQSRDEQDRGRRRNARDPQVLRTERSGRLRPRIRIRLVLKMQMRQVHGREAGGRRRLEVQRRGRQWSRMRLTFRSRGRGGRLRLPPWLRRKRSTRVCRVVREAFRGERNARAGNRWENGSRGRPGVGLRMRVLLDRRSEIGLDQRLRPGHNVPGPAVDGRQRVPARQKRVRSLWLFLLCDASIVRRNE